jgi:hypothetical protein
LDCLSWECIRAFECVESCGSQNVVNNGCCPCPSGMLDKASCSATSLSQGVKGTVLWLEGNFMPGPGTTSGLTEPVSREVRFYEPVTAADIVVATGRSSTLYETINGVLVASVTSAQDGSFEVGLPPGTYSVFVEDEGDWFCNAASAAGECPVTVTAGAFANYVIRIDYAASY